MSNSGQMGLMKYKPRFVWDVSTEGYQIVHLPSVRTSPYFERNEDQLLQIGLRTNEYEPLLKPTIHRKFASLGPDDKELVKFAGNYGFLQSSPSVPGGRWPWGDFTAAERVEKWRDEQKELAVTLALWDLAKNRDVGKLGRFIIWVEKKIYIDVDKLREILNAGWPKPTVGPDWKFLESASTELVESWSSRYSLIEPALFYVRNQVNQRLVGQVSCEINPLSGSQVYTKPLNLLAAMWIMLRDEITGEIRLTACTSCGEWVEQRNARRIYCSKACKQQDWRLRNKGKGGTT